MKTLLAILLSFVISEAPVFAIHGGYSIGGSTTVTGTYAGALIPTSDTLLVPTATDFGANALGLFTLGVPSTGLGSGEVFIFTNGQSFTGTIQAVPTQDATGITGIVDASFDYTLTEIVSGSVASIAVTASAQGPFNANIVSDANSAGGLGVDLSGTTELDVTTGAVDPTTDAFIITEQVTFQIEGFQQSLTATTTSGSG